MQERREKKALLLLWWEVWTGHKSKRKQFFLLDGHESEVEATCEAENNIRLDDFMVSMNAIFGSTSHPWEFMATSRRRSLP